MSIKTYRTRTLGYVVRLLLFSVSCCSILTAQQTFSNFQNANLVVGQNNFTNTGANCSQSGLYGPAYIAVSSKGVLAVAEQSAGRVMLWNNAVTANGAPANIVVGKPNFNVCGGSYEATTRSTMRTCDGVAFTPDGNKLIVADSRNNRVLIWNTIPTTNGQDADVVLGQTDFTSAQSGTAADKFNYPTGIFISNDGKLIISDFNNNRVLIWNKIPSSNGVPADVVVGQLDFTTSSCGDTADKMCYPWGVWVSNDGKLLIGDAENYRVLIFNQIPTQNGTSANVVIGQTDFGIYSGLTSASSLGNPVGVTVDPNGRLAVGQFSSYRVSIFNSIPTSNGAEADIVLGQPNFSSINNYAPNGVPAANNFAGVYNCSFDLNGRLFVTGRDMNRVLIFGELPVLQSDLSVTMNSTGNDICVGGSKTLVLSVTNHGPDNATGVIATAMLPAGFNYSSHSSSTGSYISSSGYWTIGNIPSGATVTLSVNGIANTTGSYPVYGSIIQSNMLDNNLNNNTASLNFTISAGGSVNTVGPASTTPTLCVNTQLTPITHATSGGTGISNATGLPTGVTATWGNNMITISGTPTEPGIYNYSVPLSGGCGNAEAIGSITVLDGLNPGNISITGETICSGGSPSTIANISAANGGDGSITYSWRSSADNFSVAIAGATEATFTPPAGLTNTTTYRRYAKDSTCNTNATASSGSWTVTVRPAFNSGTISTTGEIICYNGSPTQIGSMTAASGGDNNITYSWRSSADNYSAAIAGATGATFIPPAGLTSTTTYRRYAKDGTCNTNATASSGSWTVTLRPVFNSGTISTIGEVICYNGSPTQIGSMTAASGGDNNITYSWRSSVDNYSAAIAGATGATFIPPAGLTSTTTYRRYAKDGTCNTNATASSGSWTVTVTQAPTLICPANMAINTNNEEIGNCTGRASWLHPSGFDGSCLPLTLSMSVSGAPPTLVHPGDTQSLLLEVGNHTIEYTLTDGGGNSAACSFVTSVTDNEAPIIICNNKIVNFNGQASIAFLASELATATDNCEVSELHTSLSSVSCSQIGQTLVATLQVTDINGLTASCQSLISVTGFPCGWQSTEDGVNCEDGNMASYDPVTQIYTLTGINCHTPVGSHLMDGGAFIQRTLCGNSSITAFVRSIESGIGWAGLTMRENNIAGAKKVSLTTNRNFNHRREVRAASNTMVSPQYWLGQNRYWLRLLRINQQIVGYYSNNGVNWQQVMVGTVQMNSCIEAGLWLFNSNPTGTLTATFSNVTTTGNTIMNLPQEIEEVMEGKNVEQAISIAVFPNPSAGNFFLDLAAYRDQQLQLRVTDMLGREIYTQIIDSVSEDIHTLMLPETIRAGYYQLSVESSEMGIKSAKIVVVRD